MAKKVIVATGFSPFGNQVVNDSWTVVRQLKNLGIAEELDVTFDINEIPVTYCDSKSIVEQIWNEKNPNLVIHVGVHRDDNVRIEQLARRRGYCKPDENCDHLKNGTIELNGDEAISTGIDLQRLLGLLPTYDVNVEVSQNAGNFLCEYTYYHSLIKNRNRALFLHIPPATSSVPLVEKVTIVRDIISVIHEHLLESYVSK